jgi:hypothetical protein
VIDIFRVDELGSIQAAYSDPEALHELLADGPPQNSCCLRFIDPYGDTTVNQLQLPVLAAELRAAAAKATPALRQRVEALAAFVETAGTEVHTYVKFVGD